MATVILYSIPELNKQKNRTIRFSTPLERVTFFDSKIKETHTGVTIGHIENWWKLNQSVIIYNNFRSPSLIHNYAKIEYDFGHSAYYFIDNYNERGSNQVEYNLTMDTMMTHLSLPSVETDNYFKQALVVREHKQRFDYNILTPYYHKYPEPFNVKHIISNEQTKVSALSPRARLVFRNRNIDWKPVAYVYSEVAKEVPVSGGVWIGEVNNIPAGNHFETSQYVWDGDYRYSKDGGATWTVQTEDWANYFHLFQRWEHGGGVVVRVFKSSGAVAGTGHPGITVTSTQSLTLEIGTILPQRNLYLVPYEGSAISWAGIQNICNNLNRYGGGNLPLKLFSDINIYDSSNERIIEIPYLPSTGITYHRDGFGIYIELDTKLNFSINHTFNKAYDFTRTADRLRVPYNDPKLFTSQFSPIIIKHQDGQFLLKREMIDFQEFNETAHTHTILLNTNLFTPSNFNLLVQSNYSKLESINEEKQAYVINNEIASVKDEAYTYNQYYKDIDEKTLRINQNAQLRNAAIGTINQVAGVAGGAMSFGGGGSFNPAQLASRGLGAGISIFDTWAAYGDNMKVMKLEREKQLAQILLSQSQISGSSLDFLKVSSDDKIKIYEFQPIDHERDYYDITFHKYGYTTLEYKSLEFKTRRYFNYIQAILEEYEVTATMTEEVYNDIRDRFAQGITFFHIYNDSIDWSQIKENWEINNS